MSRAPSTPERACLALELVDDRHRKTVVDQIVHGLVYGSLLGEGLAIQSRDAAVIDFERQAGAGPGPSAGRIEVTSDGSGKTLIQCQLFCGSLRWLLFAQAALTGAIVATVTLLLFGWLIVVSLPVAGAVAWLTDTLGWRRTRRMLRTRFETFLANSRYLDPL